MSKLYIIPTPIGNLEDITLRALRILKEVDLIFSEDTRKSGILLNHYEIHSSLHSYHNYNEHATLKHYINLIKNSESAALISDAGTPGISDPGFLLVRECLRNDIDVECLPGPVAFVPALVNSGLPIDNFCFKGFLPSKKRQSKIKAIIDSECTVAFYESPFRLLKTLEQLAEAGAKDRKASVSRELTKIYEETVRGTVEEIYNYYKDKTIKGEIVIVIQGKE
ncbi:MAG: 16S rRNA (cytidine(1402)-2'-O)-methyltransferase [Bacteroidales bacterium]|nr:16S rRNA (cytidine(1402)-2'-O)-methyltransferase [Bacteroidales bacterium]